MWFSCVLVKESEIFVVMFLCKMYYVFVGFWLGFFFIFNGRCYICMKIKNGLKCFMDENWIMNCLVFFVVRIWYC